MRPTPAFRSMLRISALAVLAVVLALGGQVLAGPQQIQRLNSAFGFEFGEERRYELGPPDALAPGELAEWTIKFEQFEESPDGILTLFRFTHDRLERLPGDYFNPNAMMNVIVEGRLKANLAGFPVFVEYTQRFILQGEEMDNTGRRTLTFIWDPERQRYDKEIHVGTRDWEFRFGVPNQKYLDLDAPRGLYLFMPGSLSCLGDSRIICVEMEPALANPGFLSFLLPALEEMQDAEREFLFFMPTGLDASPFTTVTAGPWLSRERNQFKQRERYFDFMKLKLLESQEVEVGPRSMHAWEIDMCCGVKTAWVEPDGRVLRVDLETTMTNPDDRWIRVIHGFEEFMSPNDDLDNRRKQQ